MRDDGLDQLEETMLSCYAARNWIVENVPERWPPKFDDLFDKLTAAQLAIQEIIGD